MTAMTAIDAPSFPPLLRGRAVPPGADPMIEAARAARDGADPGLVVWSEDTATMRAALVLAPEMPLARAVGVVFAVALGFADSFGALAPPEIAVHFDWPGRIRINGARCGRVRAIAAPGAPSPEPDWLVVGLEVACRPVGSAEPGLDPDTTTLFDEGAGDIGAVALIESWARHSIVWINRFVDDGFAPVHAAWLAKHDRSGQSRRLADQGRVLGIDEAGGLLVATADRRTRLSPLTDILEAAP
jgi:biotin-(acetyl-CoA carboxylase) ligase